MFQRPFLVCYICGREFGTASIGIHEPQCLQKWHQRNNLLPKSERMRPPVKPREIHTDGSSDHCGYRIDLPTGDTKFANTFNEAAEFAANANLVPCPTCGRTFDPNRIEVHRRVCKASTHSKIRTLNTNNTITTKLNNLTLRSQHQLNAGKPKLAEKTMSTQSTLLPCPKCSKSFSPASLKLHLKSCRMKEVAHGKPPPELPRRDENDRKTPRKPITAVCYICGREYGTWSISIHEPKCLEKWNRQNNELPPSMRRKPPKRPISVPIKTSSNYDVEKYNEKALEISKTLLVPCSRCKRTFNPERIEIHERICMKQQH